MTGKSLEAQIANIDPRVALAQQFCKQAHAGVERIASGKPYYEHPNDMAKKAFELQYRDWLLFVGIYMHDVPEDTEYTKEDVAKLFGVESGIISSELDRTRKSREEYVAGIVRSDYWQTPVIKSLDLWHNTTDLSHMVQQYFSIGGSHMKQLRNFGFELIETAEPQLLEETKKLYEEAFSWLKTNKKKFKTCQYDYENTLFLDVMGELKALPEQVSTKSFDVSQRRLPQLFSRFFYYNQPQA